MNKRKSIILLIDVIFLAILIFLDQITKYFAIVYLKGQESLKVVDGVFEFNYLENRGAAFGMLQDQKFFFVFIAVVILAVIAYVLFKTPNQKKYTKLHIALVFIAAGACFGFSVNGTVTTRTMQFGAAGRNEVRRRSTEYALQTMLELLSGIVTP